MNVKQLIAKLKTFSPETEVVISSDEELNCLYRGFEVADLIGGDTTKKQLVIYGRSGEEIVPDTSHIKLMSDAEIEAALRSGQ